MSILFKDAAKEVFLGLCTVFGTEMFCFVVEAGYESFGVDRHLVGAAAEMLDWTMASGASTAQGQTRCTMLMHARLECVEEEIALADEVVERGEQGVEGTLWRDKVKRVGEGRDKHACVSS